MAKEKKATKKDLLKYVAGMSNITPSQAEKAIDGFLMFLTRQLEKGESVGVSTFGDFFVVETVSNKRRTVHFRSSRYLIQLLNNAKRNTEVS